jgi:hypothetical protein
MSGFKGFLGKVGLVLVTSVATATIAGTGVASALNVPNGSVNSAKIVNNSVRSVDIKNNSVHSIDVTDDNLTGADIHDGSLGGLDLADGSVVSADIAEGTVSSADIADGQVGTSDIGDGQVTSGDIANGTIAAGDLAPTAITRWAKIDASDAGTALMRGRGAVAAARVNVGMYTVTFLQPITSCGWTATVNDNDFESAGNLYASVERNAELDDNTLRIRTFNAAGVATDTTEGDGFTVTVTC